MPPRAPLAAAAAARIGAATALLLLLAPAAAQQLQQPQPGQLQSGLKPSESFVGSEPDGRKAVFAPQVVLAGRPLGVVPAKEASDCAAACRAEPDCGWVNFCGEVGGCASVGGDIPGLKQGECLLMDSANCTLVPPVALRGAAADIDAIGGFPVRADPLPGLPGMVARTAQGLVGGDFECQNSALKGACAFTSSLLAAAACTNAMAATCRAVVVYMHGNGGCSGGELAVLKTANLAPANSFMSPYVYTLERVEGAPTGGFLLHSQTSVIGMPQPSTGSGAAPTGAPAAAPLPAAAPSLGGAPAPLPAVSTEWLGCIVSNVAALMEGDVVATLSGLVDAEACCRACRADGRCNVWNYCSRPEGCSFEDLSTKVALSEQQCELRYQRLVAPPSSAPPFLHAKGQDADSFIAGMPIAAPVGAELPGYTRYVAGGLFGQPGYPCSYSALPELQECVLSGTLSQVGSRCDSDAACAAILYKPLGSLGERSAQAILRSPEGANASLMVVNPSTTLYLKAGSQDTAGSGGSSGSLSAGAIAGIAAGCAVVAVAAAAGGWVLMRRRRAVAAARHVPSAVSEKSADAGPLSPSELAAGSSCGPDPPAVAYRGTLGRPPSMPGAVAVAAPGGPPAEQEQQAAWQQPCSVTVSSSNSSGGSQVLARYALSQRPPSASPFAAQRQSRMGGFGAAPPATPFAAGNGDGLSLPGAQPASSPSTLSPGGLSVPLQSGSSVPPAPSGEHELVEAMTELLQYRAAEDAAGAQPGDGAMRATGSGGGSGSHATGGSGTSGLSRTSLQQPAGSGTLPQSLVAWLIEPDAVEYQRRPDGEPAVLGEGASGRVLRATLNGEPVAAKEVNVGKGAEAREAFITEAQRMQALRHPHIVTLFGLVLSGSKGVLVMELCEGRDLGSALQLRNTAGERLFGWWRHGASVAREVASAVNYLHAKSLVHMDIKSSNVLLTARGVAKLSDWGSSKRHIEGALSTLPAAVGTFAWMAPEVIMGQRCTTQVDIYSFGVLLWEIVTGGKPRRGEMRMPHVPEECPQEVAQLVEDCMALDPGARPTATQLVQRLAAAPRRRREGGLDAE